jgi:hypothetical protein
MESTLTQIVTGRLKMMTDRLNRGDYALESLTNTMDRHMLISDLRGTISILEMRLEQMAHNKVKS